MRLSAIHLLRDLTEVTPIGARPENTNRAHYHDHGCADMPLLEFRRLLKLTSIVLSGRTTFCFLHEGDFTRLG
jgi:hypothetical protein